VEQPAFNHNGGCIVFGPDGMLYIGFGDGGFQRDPNGHGQNPHTAHGSMLRIDVDRRAEGRPYAIPADNPFLMAHKRDAAILPETWAIGFREPWRFSFDPKTGDLWVGDVGQDHFEEVCRVRPGENHGWNVYEGYEPFSDEYRREGETFTFPLFAYPHSYGVSVTGGYVYRGSRAPSFEGVYIFGDYETRKVWGLKEEGGRSMTVRELGELTEHIASFGVDENGEIYVVGYEGTIFRADLSQSKFE
jgi:glucose/arabinose dehydrogenase